MFCPKCGSEIHEGYKYCANCGANAPKTTQEAAPAPKPVAAPAPPAPKPVEKAPEKPLAADIEKAKKEPAPAPVAAPAPAPAPPPPKPVIDVKKIIKSPPKVLAVEGTLDFKAAEHALVSEGLKTSAFSGFFSKAAATDVRVDSLTKIYEPVHMVRAVYEGTFEVVKDFNLNLDPNTVKVELAGKVHEVKPVAQGGGLFSSGASNALKLTGTETIKKRNEKAVYYDMNGVRKDNIGQYVKGKKTSPFNPEKEESRTQVLGTHFDASHLTDLVLTPDIVQRVQNANKKLDEIITVDIQTVYYPKYKAVVTNLKNSQQRHLIFSAVDKQVLSAETF